MGKQPIDDLFAQKLRNMEVEPGAEVFGRLQSRMHTKPLVERSRERNHWQWRYSIAIACGFILLGFVLWRDAMKPSAPGEALIIDEQKIVPPKKMREYLKNPPQVVTAEEVVQSRKRGEEVAQVHTQPKAIYRAREHNGVPTQQSEEQNGPAAINAIAFSSTSQPYENAIADANVPPSQFSSQPIVPPQPAERIIVLIIDTPGEEAANIFQSRVKPTAANQPNLSQLVNKVKQLKSGQVLASVTPNRPQTEHRTSIGRLFDGVRESLRNDNTLEP
jgi:hypothetical protein